MVLILRKPNEIRNNLNHLIAKLVFDQEGMRKRSAIRESNE